MATRTRHISAHPGAAVCFCLVVIYSAVLAGPAFAFREEFRSYPQFRYMGGLPGNGWPLNAEGDGSFDGAMSQTIPLGYTPSWGTMAIGYHVGRIKGGDGFDFDLSGQGSNGTGAISIGFGGAGSGVCLTVDAVDDNWDAAINLQFQVLRETESRPAVSVGVLDLLNEREAIHGSPPDDPGARSFYVAATKRLGSEQHPLHVTLGWGTDRFNESPLLGVCYDAHRKIKVLAEYDGFNFNAGVGAQLLKGEKDRPDALTLFVGAAALERPVVGLSYTR